jgi:hypothetical protein
MRGQRAPLDPVGKGEAMEAAASLCSKMEKLRKLADDLRTLAQTKFPKNTKEALVAGSALLNAADGLLNVAVVYDKFSHDITHLPLEETSQWIGRTDTVLKSASLFANLADNSKLHAFMKDPTPENGHAWAWDVVDTFDSAAAMVPSSIPFFTPMVRGILKAPGNYIRAFETIMFYHLREVDLVVGPVDKPTAAEGDKIVWEGALSRLYVLADADLRTFMKQYQKYEGIDLYEVSGELGRAHLMNLVWRYAAGRHKVPWANLIADQR